MKKLLTILLASLLCLCCVGMVACKDEPKADTYKVYQVVADGTTYNIGDTVPEYTIGYEAVTLTEGYMILKLFDNGKAESETDGVKSTVSMTWSQTGNVITVVSTYEEEGESHTSTTEMTVDGEFLTMYMGANTTLIMKKA